MSVDTFILGAALLRERGLEDVPYALAHDFVVSWPILKDVLVPLGAIRAGHDNVARVLEAGRKVLVYPGGDLEGARSFRRRHRIRFGPRRGYIRAALRHGATLSPVVACGAHATFVVVSEMRWLAKMLRTREWLRLEHLPLIVSAPWGVTLGPSLPYLPFPTRILIEVLDPIEVPQALGAPTQASVERWHGIVTERMQRAMDRLVDQRRAMR